MPFKFGVDSSGNYGYIKDGADTVTPFRTGNATESQVLSGYTFSNVSSSGLTGTMPNISSIDNSISSVYVEGGSNGSGIYARMNTGAHITTASSGYPELFISQTQIAGIFAANATASVITKGYTAWVNGVKITGTRAAPVKSLSGTFKFDMKKGQTYTGSITFSSAFDSTPSNISINCESSGDGCGGYWIEVTKKDRYGFSYRAGGQLYGEDTIQWRYTASL